VPYFEVTPAEIIRSIVEANELLGLPHSVHLHCNNLGTPGNYTCTLGSLGLIPDLNEKRQTLYATHVQFHAYGGSGWKDFCSKSEPIANFVNMRPQIVMDMGQVMFGRTTTMTADGPMEFNLYRLHHEKWSNRRGARDRLRIIPVIYRRKNLSTRSCGRSGSSSRSSRRAPGSACSRRTTRTGAVRQIPGDHRLLMSKKYRDAEFATIHPDTAARVPLPAIEREMDWYEIA
jgi:formylmethanofuran dehydrogenase subunit A